MSWYDFASHWQTLISGVLALFGAAATVIAVQMQIRANKKAENDRLNNEAYAARAVVPHALSEITAYAEHCMDILDEACRDRDGAIGILERLPRPPENLLQTFKDAIRFGDKERKKQLADLLSFYQVHEARMLPIRNAPGPGYSFSSLPQALIDSATLYVLASRLFSWARREEEGKPQSRVPLDDIVGALRIGARHFESNAPLQVELGRRRPKAET